MRFMNRFSTLFLFVLVVLLAAGPAFAVSYTLLNGVTTTGAGTVYASGGAKGVGCVAYSTAGSSATVTFEQSLDSTIWWTAATASNPTATGESFVLAGWPYTRPNATNRSSGTLWAKCGPLNAEVTQAGAAVPTATATASKIGVIKATWTNAELVAAAAATVYNKNVGTLPANSIVRNTFVVIGTAATTTAATTVSLGVAGTTYVDWVVASSAKAAAATIYGDATAENATENTGHLIYATDKTIYAQFLPASGTMADSLTSSGTIYVVYQTLP